MRATVSILAILLIACNTSILSSCDAESTKSDLVAAYFPVYAQDWLPQGENHHHPVAYLSFKQIA